MYLRLSILILLLIPYSIYTQPIERERVNVTDENGFKQGKWVVAFENSKSIRYSGQFKDNIPFGEFRYYYQSGEVSAVIEFKDEYSSSSRMYHKNGNLLSLGNYYQQKKDSVWWYFNARKEVLSMETYNKGILEGEQIIYYPGDPSKVKVKEYEKSIFKQGFKNGAWEQYYESGRIKAKGVFLNGNLNGIVFYYFPEGNVKLNGEYENGFKHGCWLHYGEDGELLDRSYYKKDKKLEGKEIEEFKKNRIEQRQNK